MAIQGISFMGKEGCIDPVVKRVANKAETYMGKEPIKSVEDQIGNVIRETDLKSYIDSHQIINEAVKAKFAPSLEPKEKEIAKKLGDEWAIAHGNPTV